MADEPVYEEIPPLAPKSSEVQEEISSSPAPQSSDVIVTTLSVPRLSSLSRFKLILYRLGVIEIFLGAISCVLCIITLITYDHLSGIYERNLTLLSQGLWCGMLLIMLGIVGIRVRTQSTTVCTLRSNLALSAITAFAMIILPMMSLCAAAVSRRTVHILVLHIILTLVGCAGFIATVVHAINCYPRVRLHKNKYTEGRSHQQMIPLPHTYAAGFKQCLGTATSRA